MSLEHTARAHIARGWSNEAAARAHLTRPHLLYRTSIRRPRTARSPEQYELNRIISRMVSYTLITALLGGLFAGLILLATRVLPVKGQVTVAVATLVIAALFNPLRKRVQHVADRQFNRERYDAEAVVAAFTGRLRQTIDLDAVRGDLVGVVYEAFQPAHVPVWLPDTGPHATVPASGRPGVDQPDR